MPDHEFRWQDEILQVMYWMWGENLARDVTPEQLHRFLHLEQAQLEAALEQLAAISLIRIQADQADGGKVYQLTERGIAEGKRRFLDEFSSYLGKESHLMCDEPDCDCHAPDWDGLCHASEVP